MSGRLLAAGSHGYDDLAIGDRVETAEAIVPEAMIDRFAELTGDRFAIHMSEEAARELGFPRRVAHGLLVLSLIDGLKNQAPAQIRAIASLGWDWTFSRPVLAGDRVRAILRVRAKRLTRDERRGIVTFDVEVLNQHGEVVQQGCNRLMVSV